MTLEDLGRHNAVDKIIGYCFLNGVATRDKLLLTTGRVTSEVVTKASRANFSVVVSKSSASSMAVALAKQVSIDIVSYVKGNRFNYFSFGGTELIDEGHHGPHPVAEHKNNTDGDDRAGDPARFPVDKDAPR